MHLKNFSLIYDSANNPVLAPAYDMLPTAMVNPMELDAKQRTNIFSKMEKAKRAWIDFIKISFFSDDFKSQYIQLINDRFKRLNMD
jgi:serine/threonine-protein kinase HipA